MAGKRQSKAEIRREALLDVRASVRADILLEPTMSVAQILDRVTKTIDAMIEATA